MSAKLLYSLSDENAGVHKHIGCMNGIFQLFDRRHFVSDRRINGNSLKRHPAGESRRLDAEVNKALQKSTMKNLKAIKEQHRTSTDSSRSSLSSSCNSSNFSSLDDSRSTRLESASLSRSNYLETKTKETPTDQLNGSFHCSWQSLEIQDVVKQSINREFRGISVRSATKDEPVSLTYIDSPRPLSTPNFIKTKLSNLELLGVPPNFCKTPTLSERAHPSRTFPLKDTPRFSYDGRESRESFRSNMKLKELPRHSLDSKRGSTTGASQANLQNFRGNHQKEQRNTSQIPGSPKEPQSNKQQSSIVAKLMGLEALPDSMADSNSSWAHSRTNSLEAFDPFLSSSKATEEHRPRMVRNFSQIPEKPVMCTQVTNADPTIKTSRNSKFPVELAPWKITEGRQSSGIVANQSKEADIKAPNSTMSVYGEIEKRLAQLEFKKSGKDLRALKQILEAMQKSKAASTSNKESQASTAVPGIRGIACPDQRIKLANPRGKLPERPTSPAITGAGSPRSLRSSIVIMKPASYLEEENSTMPAHVPPPALRKLQIGHSASSRKKLPSQQQTEDPTPTPRRGSSRALPMDRNTTRRNAVSQSAKVQKQTVEDTNMARNSGAVSPRLQQRKLRSSDTLGKTNQTGRQTKESRSPRRAHTSKNHKLVLDYDQRSEVSGDTGDLSEASNSISLLSESSISIATQDETEVTSTIRTPVIRGPLLQNRRSGKKLNSKSKEEKPNGKRATVATEQPSPISVLDAAFSGDELPSPVKMISNAFRDDESLLSDESEWNQSVLNHMSSGAEPKFNLEPSVTKSVDIPLVQQRMRGTNSSERQYTIHTIASACDSTNLDHIYISEILMASGLLTNFDISLSTLPLFPSDKVITDNLFLSLEKIKEKNKFSANNMIHNHTSHSKGSTKLQRKFIFDVVNELLVQKIMLDNIRFWSSGAILEARSTRSQQLLKGLCSEFDQLQANSSNCTFEEDGDSIIAKDLMTEPLSWRDGYNDISGLVLDVERLIFKDMINEVVSIAACGLRAKPTSYRRQLFT